MSLRAVLLSAILLTWSPTAHGRDLSLGDIVRSLTADTSDDSIRSADHQEITGHLERLQNQLAALQEQLSEAQSTAEDCPANWSRHNNSCYLIPAVTATWFGANVLCPTLDGRARLASVHSDNHQFVEDMAAATSDAQYLWVGGSRLRSGGSEWGWQDGTVFDFTNWAPGQSGSSNQDCMCLQAPTSTYSGGRTGQMHDGPCTHATFFPKFICQIKLTK